MFDIGWTELLVIAVVLIVVVGPKDLPPMIRAFGKMTANFRKMAGDFRTQFDEALREADMDDVRKTISDAQKLNPTNALRDAINPLRQMGQDIKSDLQKATQIPSPLAENTTEFSPTDAEAQQSIEGAEPISAAPEVPASVEPAAAATAAPTAVAANTVSAPVTPVPVVADAKNLAQAAPVAATPAKVEAAVAKPRAPRTSVVKAGGEAKVRSKSSKNSAGSSKTIAEIAPVVERPKRAKAAPKKTVETASVAVEAPVTKAPARKRTPKKTDTPKDEA
ncbi:twin-arginine translocase subunit TatB [Agrobacterium sp. Ap1]|uniref:Sec-independent protein translocase protein TatB n=1 Tax=Agrobacterium sp. Ap1 TaxID=2815337 RepID=UPI001A8F2583|nr:Sec-independent protein translocase protein TatB [Agrobacterium sp. Ap1]MBO0141541.1 twin-arginine translocase subunit TatB [Agrobacterium sp. Ap1]